LPMMVRSAKETKEEKIIVVNVSVQKVRPQPRTVGR